MTDQERTPEFEKEDFEDFNPIELAEFYGFLFALHKMRGDDMPFLLFELYQDTRGEFIRRQGAQFVEEFETTLATKNQAHG